ncbi:MAG TPA: CPBP family intramembrane metalloprotease [Spirochaetota bacterium]|nr:CPBP family intramembrane metalloprotease [Spirochaetota bacterium]HOD16392.1 CPBP family intramembrane metalloprotease [Spirochaetota bacterium]HPG49975.1 CPBP family intramembrane metalloprotease [Spirochaetota bacterium]HPN12848.1 CPBP family intramembrane metalloprotease [Spirochaetota bacterium]HQL81348.1 CPBP family intramembrane metalloprotease [Spirochaetota bacterium]
MTGTRRSPAVPAFMVIVATALAAQLIGTYFARALVVGDFFYLSWFLLRIPLPLAVLLALKVPLSEIGLGLPRVDRGMARVLVAGAVVLVAAFAGIYFMSGYFSFYSGSFAGPDGGRAGRFANFMIFTSSTLTGWEFLHRGFLLMGLRYALGLREKIPEKNAALIAAAIVWVFEVVFHFIKPPVEALGLLVGSPLLSWLALRTRSIWLPFLFHLAVEILFILSLIMR